MDIQILLLRNKEQNNFAVLNPCLSILRSGTASRRSAGTRCLHLIQPVWCPNLDASAPHGPQRTPQRHAAYWGTPVTSLQTQLLSVSLLCTSRLGPIKSSKNQYKPLSVWFRWPWKRLCLISAVLITTTGWSTSSSSQTTSSWCSQTFSCHPATMHRRVRYKDTCLKEQLIQKIIICWKCAQPQTIQKTCFFIKTTFRKV